MTDPETLYNVWRAERTRQDVAQERRRAHLQAAELDPTPVAPRTECDPPHRQLKVA